MNWIELKTTEDPDELIVASASQPVLIFKHSTTCGTSALVKNKLERNWAIPEKELQPYYLDLLRYRSLSNLVGDRFGVIHESPQVLLIIDGKSVYNASHFWVDHDRIKEELNSMVKED